MRAELGLGMVIPDHAGGGRLRFAHRGRLSAPLGLIALCLCRCRCVHIRLPGQCLCEYQGLTLTLTLAITRTLTLTQTSLVNACVNTKVGTRCQVFGFRVQALSFRLKALGVAVGPWVHGSMGPWVHRLKALGVAVPAPVSDYPLPRP